MPDRIEETPQAGETPQAWPWIVWFVLAVAIATMLTAVLVAQPWREAENPAMPVATTHATDSLELGPHK